MEQDEFIQIMTEELGLTLGEREYSDFVRLEAKQTVYTTVMDTRIWFDSLDIDEDVIVFNLNGTLVCEVYLKRITCVRIVGDGQNHVKMFQKFDYVEEPFSCIDLVRFFRGT